MTLTVSRVLGSQPESLGDAADRVALSAMAAEAGIANEKAGFVSLGASWAGSASTGRSEGRTCSTELVGRSARASPAC